MMQTKDLEHQLDLLSIHKNALNILDKQIAFFQAFVPPFIQMDFDNRLKESLHIILESINLVISEYPLEAQELKAVVEDIKKEKLPVAELIIQRVLVHEKIKKTQAFSQNKTDKIKPLNGGEQNDIRNKSINKIKDLITSGNTEDALCELLLLTHGQKLYDEAIMLSARFEIFRKERRMGISVRTETSSEINKIHLAIIEILNEI